MGRGGRGLATPAELGGCQVNRVQESDIPTQPDQPSENILVDELDMEIEAEMAAEAAREKAKAAERTQQ